MILNPEEQDAFNEMVNIGFGRAASALSMLVDQRVILEAPQAELVQIIKLEDILTDLAQGELINVHQIFRGKLSGEAMLVMDPRNASILVDLIEHGSGTAHPLTASDREALIEIGNILLNAFLGSFGNLLKARLSFTVPHFTFATLKDILTTSLQGQQVEIALVVKIRFRLARGDVNGYVIIIMGITSLNTLLEAMRAEGYLI